MVVITVEMGWRWEARGGSSDSSGGGRDTTFVELIVDGVKEF